DRVGGSGTGIDGVRAVTGLDPVVACSPVDDVVAGTRADDVVSAAGGDPDVAVEGHDDVVALRAVDRDLTWCLDNRRGVAVAGRRRGGRRGRQDAVADEGADDE